MRLQLTQILLHAGRLKLEGAHRVAVAIKLISQFVVDGDMVDINIHAVVLLNHAEGILDDGEVLQPQEVHLNEAHRLHHVAVILGHQHLAARLLIVDGANGGNIGNVLCANDNATGVNAHLPVGVLQFCGIGEHILQFRTLLAFQNPVQLRHILIAVDQVDLGRLALLILDIVGEIAVGNELLEVVDCAQRHLLHSSHVGNTIHR